MASESAPVNIAIVGAGNMARTRGRAFLDTGRVRITAVASRRADSARACADELNCEHSFDDYRRLADVGADAVLIETPHLVQDDIALWALEAGFDLLIGGCLASNATTGARIVELAAKKGLLVEAGFQRRYDPAWEEIRRLLHAGDLGLPVMAVMMGLWRADPDLWYFDQRVSGGMPVTHMSYCGLNLLHWILGRPVTVSAQAGRRPDARDGDVIEETCAALVGFDGGAFASVTASYIGPTNMDDADARIVCTDGGIRVGGPAPQGHTAITVSRGSESHVQTFADEPSSFVRQAHAFVDALTGNGEVRNPAADALVDVQVAEAISIAARESRLVRLDGDAQAAQ